MGGFHKILTLGIIILLSLVLVIQTKKTKEGFYGQAWSWNADSVWNQIMRSGDERSKYYYQAVVGRVQSPVPIIGVLPMGANTLRVGYTNPRTEPHFRNRLAVVSPNWQLDSFRGLLSSSEEWRDAFMRRIRYSGEAKLARFELAYDLAKTYKNRPPVLSETDMRDTAKQSKWLDDFRRNNPHESLLRGIVWWMFPSAPKFYDPEIGNIDAEPQGPTLNDYYPVANGDALGDLPDEYLDALLQKWKLYETYRTESFYFDWDDENMYFYDLNSKQLKRLTKEEAEKGSSIQSFEAVVANDDIPGGGLVGASSEAINQVAAEAGQSIGISAGATVVANGSTYMTEIANRKIPFLKTKKRIARVQVPRGTNPIEILLGIYLDSLLMLADQMLSDQFPNLKPCNPGEFDLSTLPTWARDLIMNFPIVGSTLGRALDLLQPYLCIGRSCPSDREMDRAGGLCYPRCRSGFRSNDITMCINNNNALDFYDRGVGSPAIYFRFKERDIPAYQRINQLAQQRTNDLKAIRYIPNYSDGTCVINAEDNATIMKAARLFISLTNNRQWITKINKAIVSSSRSIDFEAQLNNQSTRVMRFYFTKDATGCSFTPRGLTLVRVGQTTWDFTIYGGKEINLTLDYGISNTCRTNNVGNTCSSPLVLNAALAEMPKAMDRGEWLSSVDEVKDVSETNCLYKANVDNFNPETNRPIGRTKNIIQANISREFDPATCKVSVSTVSDLGNETAIAATDTRRTGYRTLSPASTFAARPPPTEKTLQGCSAKCSDSSIISRLVYQYNKSSGANSKIIRVKKASTPTPLSCDFLMDMVIRDAQGNTRMMETSRRMNVRKVGTTCDFDYVSLENSNTGFFIQENSPETAEQVSFSSAVQSFMKATNDALGRYMDGVSSANQVSDKNVRDTMTREQNAQQEEASARALATARTADGMRTLSQCSIAANSRTILDIIERMIREILRRDPLNAADFSAGTVAIRFDKWGYDNTTNTVILDYNVSLTRRWRQFRHIGGFRFYTGLCSPPRIDKATIFIMEAGLTPNTWREPGPANRFFVSPLGEIKNSPSTDTDTVNILSNGSQATNFFVPPPPPPPPPPTLTIHSARWGRSGNTIDVTDTIRTRIQNNASQISLDQFILGTLPGDRRNQHFYTLSIEYSFGNGPRKTFSQTESRTNSFINVSSLT